MRNPILASALGAVAVYCWVLLHQWFHDDERDAWDDLARRDRSVKR